MAAMSDALEVLLVNHLFRTDTWAKPTVLACALLTTDADDANTGIFTAGTGVEVTDAGSYARVNRAPLDANWDASSGTDGLTSNTADIDFTQASASWGTVTGMGITDNAGHNLGLLWVHGALASSKVVDSGDTFKFPAGDLDVTMA